MNAETDDLRRLIVGMRRAYARGDNAMAYARANSMGDKNSVASTLVAYDLQAGNYVDEARRNPKYINGWCEQLADLLRPFVDEGDSILEVGVGEATTLAGVIKAVRRVDVGPMGFDVSWSRVKVAIEWITENAVNARLFVGDLFHIPLEDNSIDVIYTSHSLEPNGGRERAAIAELLRVARKAVVLVEPIYELANEQAKARMSEHGYVRGLKVTSEELGAKVVEYGLLDLCNNDLNPSGIVLLTKSYPSTSRSGRTRWQCPMTGVPMVDQTECFYAARTSIAYPVLRGIPLLRSAHAVIASQMGR